MSTTETAPKPSGMMYEPGEMKPNSVLIGVGKNIQKVEKQIEKHPKRVIAAGLMAASFGLGAPSPAHAQETTTVPPGTPAEITDLGILTPEGQGGTEASPTQETPEIVATPGESETFQESYEYQSTDTFELKPTGANSEDETQNWTLTVTRDGKSYDFKLYESAQDLQDKRKLGFEEAEKRGDQLIRRTNIIFIGTEATNLVAGDQGQFQEPFHLLIGLMYNEKDGTTLQVVFPRYDSSKVMNPNTGSAQPVPEVFDYLDRLPPGRMISLEIYENIDFDSIEAIKENIFKRFSISDEAACKNNGQCALMLYLATEYSGQTSGLVQWEETGATDGLVKDEFGRAIVLGFGGLFK